MSCTCWRCRKERGPVAVAPFLASMWREARRRDPIVAACKRRIHRAEKLVEHRELQLIRAGRSRQRGYIRLRENKLWDARNELRRAKQALEEAV